MSLQSAYQSAGYVVASGEDGLPKLCMSVVVGKSGHVSNYHIPTALRNERLPTRVPPSSNHRRMVLRNTCRDSILELLFNKNKNKKPHLTARGVRHS